MRAPTGAVPYSDAKFRFESALSGLFQRAELLRFIAFFADDGISALKAQRRFALRRDKHNRQPVVGHADVRLSAERQRAAERVNLGDGGVIRKDEPPAPPSV